MPRLVASVAAVLALSGVSLANAQTPVRPQPAAPNMPERQNTVPEKVEPNSTGSTGTLSDKLNQSGGVISPPSGIDPGMSAKPPVADPGSTRIITPPGSPGGNQSIQPK